MYNAEPSLALAQLNSHLRRFSELSTKIWGIGEATYEYWAWVGRQLSERVRSSKNTIYLFANSNRYRVFAELLEQGTLSVPPLTIPTVIPTSASTAVAATGAAATAGSTTLAPSVGHNSFGIGVGSINPSTHLMHPGFYYAAAATCAEKRRARFLEVLVVAEGAGGEGAPAPGFANEKKSDHLGTILEVCRFCGER